MKKLIILLALLNIAVLAQRPAPAAQRQDREAEQQAREAEQQQAREAERQAREAEQQQAREAERQAREAAKDCKISDSRDSKTFTDPRDKKEYKFVKIGKQTWMAQNLDYHGEDGFLGLCYGDKPKENVKNPENCEVYGRLYDWSEAMGIEKHFNEWYFKEHKVWQGICPKGWHLPTIYEWFDLLKFVKDNESKLKTKCGWREYDFSEGKDPETKCKWKEENVDDRGRVTVKEYDFCLSDDYGFSALPSGLGSNGRFKDIVNNGYWWSTTGHNSMELALTWQFKYNREVSDGANYNAKSQLLSVRCIKDN